MSERIMECPLCGSRQLFVRSATRKIYIEHNGEQIPLLTVNGLARPVIQTSDETYHCACSWSSVYKEV